MTYGARLSDDRVYRYELTREWNRSGETCVFIGLNPSTADEQKDDPTIRKCIGFARRWGCERLVMLNLFAYRATDPRHMRRFDRPIGPDNDAVIDGYALFGSAPRLFIAAWGRHGTFQGRDAAVCERICQYRTIMCLGRNNDGTPEHPLYVPYDRPMSIYRGKGRKP
jgi:hypothetical protein